MPDQQTEEILNDLVRFCPAIQEFADAIARIDRNFIFAHYYVAISAHVEVEVTISYRGTSGVRVSETREYCGGYLRSQRFNPVSDLYIQEACFPEPNFPRRNYVTFDKPSRPKACNGCSSYHGQTYGGNKLVCGMHPYGWEGDECPDWEEEVKAGTTEEGR